MKQIIRSRILGKFLILSILTAGLIFVISSSNQTQSVLAAPCCSQCEADENICFSEGHGGYPSYWECAEAYQIYDCYSTCINCVGGGGTSCGNSCQYDFQCLGQGTTYCGFCIQNICQ